MRWIEFFEASGIDYVSRGPNTRRGEISIKCPFCGDDDPSQHLGVNPQKGFWGCLRDASHRGKTPPRLIAALLGCSTRYAKQVEKQYNAPDPDTLEEAIAMLSDVPEDKMWEQIEHEIKMLDEFKDIKETGSTARFWRYLESRGFDDVGGLCSAYSLRCAHTGRYKDRIIIPLYQSGALIGWTGRALGNPTNAPRYLSSSGVIKSSVFREDWLTGGDVLFVTEGPFDAMKLDYYGAPATCIFGTTITEQQLVILANLSGLYQKVVILFDNDAIGPSFYTQDWLNAANVVIGRLPEGVKDPGEMGREQIKRLVDSS